MGAAPAARFLVCGLAACLLGLAVCPFFFVAIGALSHFPPMFSLVMLPPFLLGSGFLLFRYLAKPPGPPVRPLPLLLLEGLSWIAVAVFLFFVSGINLATRFERVGAVCTAFVLAWAICLPIALLRRNDLERRLAHLSHAATLALLLSIVVPASVIAAVFLKAPPAFV